MASSSQVAIRRVLPANPFSKATNLEAIQRPESAIYIKSLSVTPHPARMLLSFHTIMSVPLSGGPATK